MNQDPLTNGKLGGLIESASWATPVFVGSLFCASVAASWLLIANFGSDIPFWDQWGAEGAGLFKPLLTSGVVDVPWFGAHNEHRIFLTRITAAVLLKLNGQWDAIVETCFNALLHAGVGVALIMCVIRTQTSARNVALLGLLVLAGSALPFGWENTLAGFQSQWYYVALFTVGVLWLAASQSSPGGGRIAILVALATGAVFSVASGAIACFVAAAVLSWRASYSTLKVFRWRFLLAAALLLLIGATGALKTPTIPGHAALQPTTVYAWLKAFLTAMAWPMRPISAPLLWMPFSMLIVNVWRTRGIPTSRSSLFILALGAFVLLNDMALAWSRGANGGVLASRYTDLFWLGSFVNAWALLTLADQHGFRRLRPAIHVTGAAIVLIGIVSLSLVSIVQLDGARERKQVYELESANVLKYIESGDFSALSGQPFLAIPFPDANFLRQQLDDPALRAILPPGIRPGLLSFDGAIVVSTFYSPGTHPQTQGTGGRRSFGSYGPSGDADRARLESAVLHPTGKLLSFGIAGNTSVPGERLALAPANGSPLRDVLPSVEPGLSWMRVSVAVPQGGFKIVAEDGSRDFRSWFAFTDPVEVGRVRAILDRWLTLAQTSLVIALAIFLVSGAYLATNPAQYSAH